MKKFQRNPGKFKDDILWHVFVNYSRAPRKCYVIANGIKSLDELKASAEVQDLEGLIQVFASMPPSATAFLHDLLEESSGVINIVPDRNHEPSFAIPTN